MQQTFTFTKIKTPPVISILRGFSAPVLIDLPRTLEELAFLSQYDSDAFNRWDAVQQLSQQVILALVSHHQKGSPLVVNPVLLTTFEKILTLPIEDLAYFSLLLTLPSEAYLAEQMPIVDFEGIHIARELVFQTIAQRFKSPLFRLLSALSSRRVRSI
jgi:aminopeptidase N